MHDIGTSPGWGCPSLSVTRLTPGSPVALRLRLATDLPFRETAHLQFMAAFIPKTGPCSNSLDQVIFHRSDANESVLNSNRIRCDRKRWDILDDLRRRCHPQPGTRYRR